MMRERENGAMVSGLVCPPLFVVCLRSESLGLRLLPPEQGDGGTTVPSNPTLLGASEYMTRLLRADGALNFRVKALCARARSSPIVTTLITTQVSWAAN
ncbi:transcription factor MYB113-like [Pyrus ussuriensis x Pyrus communis]|uniref:Transcription factor MYB113-like n=1 Tax=Pyrus ussuriensis x Pyrus communis TaxID=2448454 RepID=A0A5N5FNI6_9ROSA|nr:transcription factor MYB113-like [Pyrus ussuriensis x Pyrus communis]